MKKLILFYSLLILSTALFSAAGDRSGRIAPTPELSGATAPQFSAEERIARLESRIRSLENKQVYRCTNCGTKTGIGMILLGISMPAISICYQVGPITGLGMAILMAGATMFVGHSIKTEEPDSCRRH